MMVSKCVPSLLKPTLTGALCIPVWLSNLRLPSFGLEADLALEKLEDTGLWHLGRQRGKEARARRVKR